MVVHGGQLVHLRSVTLRNFRCFEHLEITLNPRLTVLVAENAGGKTAVLDGIALGLAPVLRYLSTANQRLQDHRIGDSDFRIRPVEVQRCEGGWPKSDYAQVALVTADGMAWDTWRAYAKGIKPEKRIGHHDLSAYASKILNSLKTSVPQAV